MPFHKASDDTREGCSDTFALLQPQGLHGPDNITPLIPPYFACNKIQLLFHEKIIMQASITCVVPYLSGLIGCLLQL